MTTVNNLLANIALFKFNPSSIQQVVLEHLKEVTDGNVDIVDPTNPFVFCLEAAAVNTAAFMIENSVNTRKQYPLVAQTTEDIYTHMSDVDFVDRFAVPAPAKFTIIVNKEELLNNMVTDLATNTRKIIIPKNTYFTINDINFSMEYPVEIIEQSHGGLQVVYNTDTLSPLMPLTSNIVKWDTRKMSSNGEDWLYIEVDTLQYNVSSFQEEITASLGFTRKYVYSDQFHYARVWNKSNLTNNEWIEITTTHTDQVYDINNVTAVLKLIDNQLSVNIPRIYLTTGKISGSIRVDIYETKGFLNMVLENYKQSAFTATWFDIDDSRLSSFSSPLKSLRTIFAYSAESLNGGRSALSFEKLRERVINNSTGPQDIPITNVQLETSLDNSGYSLVKDVDVVTNRIFLASRQMPIPFDEKLITAGNSSVETFIDTLSNLSLYPFIRSNGSRLTIPSNTLFLNNNGIIKLVPVEDQVALNALSNELYVKAVNSNRYLYNPFHYVLDAQSNEFELRCYYLDKPVVSSINFIDQNDSSGLQFNTDQYDIRLESTGFRLGVKMKRNDLAIAIGLSNINAQLSFIPENGVRCSINGTPRLNSKDELIFEFLLDSNFDIDSNNLIKFNNFNYFDEDERDVLSPLSQKFDLTVSVNEPMANTWQRTNIDSFINIITIPPLSIGINHEVLDIEFGKTMKNLWRRSRSVVQASQYMTHSVDIPLVYEEDVYETDPDTGSRFSVDNATGTIEYKVLNRKGEIVVNENNEIVYKYKVGDLVLDEQGKPTPLNPTNVIRQIELFFIDGVYLLANDSSSTTYRNQMVDAVVSWVVNELGDINNRTLEQTSIYFYPKTNLGTIRVLADHSQVMNIDANQVFSVQIYVSKSVYNNEELKSYITSSTIKTIDSLMNNSVITNSQIITELKAVYGKDVISVAIQGLGGSNKIETVSILNDGDRCSIGKKLQALPNGERIVVEDVNINFIQHDLSD